MQPWEGRSLWVWNMTNVEDVIAKARSIGADSVIIKSHDGSKYWDQFNSPNTIKIHHTGLKVGAWGYWYPSTPANSLISCVNRSYMSGADFYVCDAEVEFENFKIALVADALMAETKRVVKGIPIGFTSFAFTSYHPDFPWQEFAKYSDFTMPQIYWGDFKRDVHSAFVQSVNEYKKLGKPVVPIGQLYGGVMNSEISMFLQLSGASSSWWDYKDLSSSRYSVFQRGGSGMQQGSTGPEVGQLQKDLSLVLKASIKADGDYGPATTAAVKTFQQLYGVRPVDGIAGPVTMAVLKHEVALHTTKPAPAPVSNLLPKEFPTTPPPVQPKVESVNLVDVQAKLDQSVTELTNKANILKVIDLLNQAFEILKEVK